MWQNVHLSKWLPVVVLVILIMLIPVFWGMQVSQASDKATFSDLIKNLYQSSEENSLLITIGFEKPIFAQLDELTVSYGYENEQDIYIWEIGDDYICFRRIAGGAEIIVCTPFTNILSVYYINN